MHDSVSKSSASHPSGVRRSFVLRFISGKYQGGEFPIVPDKEIIVGRSSDLDMVLVEDMVSRKHARIAMQKDDVIWIEDLGSTNGTFVNGEKIKRAHAEGGRPRPHRHEHPEGHRRRDRAVPNSAPTSRVVAAQRRTRHRGR